MSLSFKDGFKAYLGVIAAKATVSIVTVLILFLVLATASQCIGG